jgi:hypothetical protein
LRIIECDGFVPLAEYGREFTYNCACGAKHKLKFGAEIECCGRRVKLLDKPRMFVINLKGR